MTKVFCPMDNCDANHHGLCNSMVAKMEKVESPTGEWLYCKEFEAKKTLGAIK